MLKNILIWISVTQLLIILFAFIFFNQIDLLSYINVAFIIGLFLILTSLTGYVIKGRFFDVVFYSFQHVFSKINDKERRPLSKLVPQNYSAMFIAGLITILLMLYSLFLYKN
ncbi:DUF3899 domain-containing protein [Virgibacillus salexigens]|uniref:DUF3899 domain-containing protein n=1 Tax=Virgibacillus massiliensis TaxID=1462526 RepID=A0A024Q7J5_9BACI|nr:DUF3899 domain-containing protein [Virgibacillus massiliensis]CDQ38200.1 hypothetical protein BN990_00467 [Virgibacillus massiliensis]